MKKIIKITYYALLKEYAGINEELIESTAKTPAKLYEEIKTKYNFPIDSSLLRVAVNDKFANWDQELQNNDHLVFITPVSGGGQNYV